MTRPGAGDDERGGPPGAGPVTRRAFLTLGGAGVLTLYLAGGAGVRPVAAAQVPGGTLPPAAIPKFVRPLVVPPAMPPIAPDTYEVAVRQIVQEVLPPPLPPTTVWGYGAPSDPATFHAPSPTIEARRGAPVTVTWVNDLVDEAGRFRPHLLPVDPTLHWANPPGGAEGRDTRPAFAATPGAYGGPVPVVTHVHGAEDVEDWSDGYAEAWYLPDAVDLPEGYATVGTWYDFFRAKAGPLGATWGPGRATFRYPNSQRPSTAWYHDHSLGITRLNVYAGPAGFYVVRGDDPADGPTVAGTGEPAVLPGPAPAPGDPPGTRYGEIPLAIQDRSFTAEGALFHPGSRAFWDGFDGPFIPESHVSPIWNPAFFGDCMVVNGRTWPYLDVTPRRYRLRLLNGSQARILVLDVDAPDADLWHIGNEGGFLAAPLRVRDVLLGPAERADVIVDLSRVAPGTTVTLRNRGPDGPFGRFGYPRADPDGTGLVLQLRVQAPEPGAPPDPSTPPEQLVLPPLPTLPESVRTRSLALLELYDEDVPGQVLAETRLGTFDPAVGRPAGTTSLGWADPETETPAVGDTETWELHNFTSTPHPIHVHDVFFQVVGRQRLSQTTGRPLGRVLPPRQGELGFKDTVVVYARQVTRVRMRFGTAGQYLWHCHILAHEDNEMMRPFRVGPPQPGQPG